MADELAALAVTVGVHAQHLADAADVELQLLRLRLRRREVAGHEDVLREEPGRPRDAVAAPPPDRARALGLALRVPLPVRLPRPRLGGHGDARLRAADAGLERALAVDELAVAIVAHALAEVPDV